MRLWPNKLNYLSIWNHRKHSLVESEDYAITNVMQNKIIYNNISVVVWLCMRCVILSQCDLRWGVMWWKFEVFVTARAAEPENELKPIELLITDVEIES